MKILVTGGAGYIGSHAVRKLLDQGHHVVVLDNLFRGHRDAVPEDVPLVIVDLLDREAIETVLTEHKIECVMNFAALAYVGESVTEPLRYYENNTAGVLTLLQAMDAVGVKKIVHSSTCATYGEPETVPITEDTPQSPINPYGWSKLFVERIFFDYAAANPGFCFAALRYFNVAGLHPEGILGEDHTPETHIIPVVLEAAMGTREKITIFGTDYDTPDGTCIRDYIHVWDLVDAHAVAMNALDASQPDRRQMIYNLGTGSGLSVRQIIDACREVTGVDFKVDIGDRRPGDPPMLYADPSKIKDELGWEASIKDVKTMVEHAWTWFKAHPEKYAE